MQRTFGTGAATNSIYDLKDTNCIMVIGANPTDALSVAGAKLKQFAMKTGNVSIVLDSRRTEIARYATHHIALRLGTNVAVLNMMMHYIIKEGLADESFIRDRTEGFEVYKKDLFNIDLDKLEKGCGVGREEIRQAAIAYASAQNAMSFHGQGVTEHSQGTFTIMQIADQALMTGNISKRGVGVNPLRGQNNVQRSADMGVQPHKGAGYLDITHPEVNAHYNTFYGVDVPSHIGY
jgi:formate dehydrogenase major subunit